MPNVMDIARHYPCAAVLQRDIFDAQVEDITHRGSYPMKALLIACLLIFLFGCATQPVPKEALNTSAVFTSGSVNVWSLTSGGSRVSLVSINGEPVDKPNGPVVVALGTHKVVMACGRNRSEFEITVEAGEVYEYAYGIEGASGCRGGLVKVKEALINSLHEP